MFRRFIFLATFTLSIVLVNVIPLFPFASNALTPSALVQPSTFTVSRQELIHSHADLRNKNLLYWPDGNIGVVKRADQSIFLAANGPKPARTIGSLDNVAAIVTNEAITIRGLPTTYSYAAGGPVYRDSNSGALLLFYHAERNRQNNYRKFYSSIGMAISYDDGANFDNLGEIVTANVSYDYGSPDIVEVGGATFAIKGEYFYLYFRDYLASGTVNHLAVARALISDVVRAAYLGKTANWYKYYSGNFSEPGLGGLSSYLETNNPSTRWMSVSCNTYSNSFVMIVAQTSIGSTNLYLTTSVDGVNWESRKQIEQENGESFYPTIMSIEDNPLYSGQSFYVYYTHSKIGEFERWKDAELVRRLIRLSLPT
uniref:Glycosyl hydrolase family 32 N-terminal domain-containing protein n=1 Tax=Cyanothece sp. (strain PCC 7425 / ATCC 29141) TaxID=395961 RepID=B8HPF5_CYAP4